MKRVLITGAGSYIGGAVRERMLEEPEAFFVEAASVRDGKWRDIDFSAFDSVVHVAGIAHVSTDPSMEGLYYEVNRDLALDVARAAKDEGVSQFVFASSIIVYGDSRPAASRAPIGPGTEPAPSGFYGKSKLEAEEGLRALESASFKVAVLRLPMVYGPGCKGNFPALAKMARALPVFPEANNLRSTLFVGNAAELVALVVGSGSGGLFLPQDCEPRSTCDIVRALAEAQGRSVRPSKALGRLAAGPLAAIPACRKAFGTLYYAPEASECGLDYRRYSAEEAARACVEGAA